MDLDNEVKQWLTVDNQLKLYNEKIKELRVKRNQLENNIVNHAVTNNTLKIGDKLKIVTVNQAEPLTFRYLEKSLGEIIKSETQVNQILDHIREKREIRKVFEIKYLK